MWYRLIQGVCALGALLAIALLIYFSIEIVGVWTDYGFGNRSSCDQARTSFFWMAGRMLLIFAIPISLCSLGFWLAGKARKKQLGATAS
jgi:hypothetical protein